MSQITYQQYYNISDKIHRLEWLCEHTIPARLDSMEAEQKTILYKLGIIESAQKEIINSLENISNNISLLLEGKNNEEEL